MSRHRNVRSMNYQDEYDGYDDVYGHSVEDGDFCVSPTTAHYYLSDRHNEPSLLGAFMTPDKIKEEDEDGSEEEQNDSLQESQEYKRPALSDVDEARLNSCLEEMRNILGDSTPEHLMVDAVIKCDFDFEKALSYVLNQQEPPKPQRERRQRRERDQEGNELTESSPPPSPTASPPKPLSTNSRTSPILRDKSPKLKGRKGVRKSQENNQNVGNVVGSSTGGPTAMKSGSGKSPQPGLKAQQGPPSGGQPMPGSFSLASLAQKYKSEPEQDGNSANSSNQTGSQAAGRVGSPLSLLMKQTKDEPTQAAGNTDTTPTSPESPHLSLAALARGEGQKTDTNPKGSLAPRSLTGSFLQQPFGPSDSAGGNSNTGFGLSSLAGSFLQPSGNSNTNLARNQAHSSSALPKGSIGLGTLAGSFLNQPSQMTKLSQDQGQTSTKPKGSLGLSSLAGSFLQKPSENTGPSSQDQKQMNTVAPPQLKSSVGLSSLAGAFLQQTSEHTNMSHSMAIDTSNQTSPGSRPLPCPGVSLAALAQQQNKSNSPSFHGSPLLHGSPKLYGSPSFQGSPSLSDLAQQHMDSSKEAEQSLSLAEMSGKKKSGVSTQFEQTSLSLSSVIHSQKDGGQKEAQSTGVRSKPKVSKSGTSLASLTQSHMGETDVDTATKEPAGFSQGISLADLAVKHHSSPTEKGETSGLSQLAHSSQTVTMAGFDPPKPPQGLGAVSLADLVSHHNLDPQKKAANAQHAQQKKVKAATGVVVKAAKPSLFGQTMCINTHCHNHHEVVHDTPPALVSSVVPFDFTTPSPDDIVKAKQRGAFTRTGERK